MDFGGGRRLVLIGKKFNNPSVVLSKRTQLKMSNTEEIILIQNKQSDIVEKSVSTEMLYRHYI
eukprot:670578-Ditylum_brightwellii.AAC.1